MLCLEHVNSLEKPRSSNVPFKKKFTTSALLTCSSILLTFSGLSTAEPQITSIKNNDSLTSQVIKGKGFTEKENPAPLFIWFADEGKSPSKLGRKKLWDGVFYGEESKDIVRVGSEKSMRWDHGSSEKNALSTINFTSDTLYIYRNIYEAFNVTDSYAIRTRATNITGQLKEGDVVTGKLSGATGTITKLPTNLKLNSSSYEGIYYSPEPETGSINDSSPIDFIYGEEMVTNGGVSFINSEGSNTYPTGTYRTFNYKSLRMWHKEGGNNSYPVAQGSIGLKYNINHENSDSTLENKDMNNPVFQIPDQWQTQELQYKTSSIDVSDGRFDFIINGIVSSENTFISRTSVRPNMYNILYQSQVSNGAQPNSYAYYDSLYVDDTWHRIILCDGAKWITCNNREIQIPTSWSNDEITIEMRLGSLKGNQYVYLYVIDADGKPNSEGYKYCPRCIVATPLEVK